MGPLIRAAVALGIANTALAGCAASVRPTASDRAIALYHERRGRPGGEAAARSEGILAPRTLTAAEAVAMAKQKSARLAELEARAATAAAAVAAEDHYENPEVHISQLRLDQVLDGAPHVETVLRVPVSRPGAVDAKVAAARAAEAEARAEARAEELALEAEIRWMFDDVRLIDAEIEAMDAVAATRRRLAEELKVRLTGSLSTSVEEAATALAAVDAEANSAEERARRATAEGALFDRLGIEAGSEVHLAGEPLMAFPLASLPSEEALITAALRSRPEIEMAASRIDTADAHGALARGKRYPWFTYVQGGYEFTPVTRNGLGWTFQTGIALPIFDTGRAGVLLSNAERAEAERAFAAAVERVTRDVQGRLREARAAAATLSEFRERALPAANRAKEEAARALESRQIDVIRALTIDERSVGVQVRFLRLFRAYRTALAELRRASGGKLP